MSGYLLSKVEYDVNDIVPIFDLKKSRWDDWAIREKEWYEEHQNYIYFMTCPGHERWFSHKLLRDQIHAYERETGEQI